MAVKLDLPLFSFFPSVLAACCFEEAGSLRKGIGVDSYRVLSEDNNETYVVLERCGELRVISKSSTQNGKDDMSSRATEYTYP